jgi:hypothetical protein
LAEGLEGIEAADFWHLDIQENQVRPLLLDPLLHFLGTACGHDLKALTLQTARQHVPIHLVVIND